MTAAEVKFSYEDYQKTIIYKPYCDPVKGSNTEGCFYQEPKKKNLATYQTVHPCNCVLWAQANGLPKPWGFGAAKNYPVNSLVPADTGFVVTYEGPYGHMARYVLDGEWLILEETNYPVCGYYKGRKLHINSPLIKGYINLTEIDFRGVSFLL